VPPIGAGLGTDTGGGPGINTGGLTIGSGGLTTGSGGDGII